MIKSGWLRGRGFREPADYSGETVGMSMLRKRTDEVTQMRRNSPWHVFAAYPNVTLIALKGPNAMLGVVQ